MNTELKEFILDRSKRGWIGTRSMELYSVGFTTREINKTIKQLLDEKIITISSPATGYRLSTGNEYGVKQSLKTRNYDIEIV